MGCEPLQLPGSACSRWPFWAVPEMVGGDVFDGGVALELAPAPAASPRTTTSTSVPATPSEAPRSAERFFAESDIVVVSFLGVPSVDTTPRAASPGAIGRRFHEPFATSLRAAYPAAALTISLQRGSFALTERIGWHTRGTAAKSRRQSERGETCRGRP